MRSNSKLVVGAMSVNTSGISTLTAEFDTKGFSFARIFAIAETTVAAHTTPSNIAITESDTSGSGFAAIAGFVNGTDYTPSTTTVALANAKMMFNIDLRGRKRYLKALVGTAATASTISLIADLSNPADGVSSAAEAGAGNIVGL